MYFDAHNHLLAAAPERETRRELVDAAVHNGIAQMLVNSAVPEDWQPLRELAQSRPAEIFPFYGVHPWHLAAVPGWEDSLAAFISGTAGAAPRPLCGIGETGIDRKKSPFPLPRQIDAFRTHLRLARRYGLPVTAHCLGAAAETYNALYPEFSGLSVLLHSFGGDISWVRKFLDRGAFFSFSAAIMHPDRRRARELFKFIPRDRLLLETDAPYMAPPGGNSPEALPAPLALPRIYEFAARERGEDLEDFRAALARNFAHFLSGNVQ